MRSSGRRATARRAAIPHYPGAGGTTAGRVALIINQLAVGGAESQVSLLAHGLRERGWTVAVFSVRPPLAHARELEAAGIPVHTLNLDHPRPAWLGTFWLIRGLRRFRPDIVHSHMYRPNIWARLIRPAVRPPVLICTAHNTAEGTRYVETVGRPELQYRITDRLCDLTTNVSRAAVQRYIRLKATPQQRIRLVPNGLDATRFRPDPEVRQRIREELGLSDRPALLAVGRFEIQKNYPLLIESFADVLVDHPEAVLLLAGDGHEADALRGLVEQRGLEEQVRFLGLRNDVPALLNAADVYVMSSDWEGLPMVLLEASAAQLPLVVTDVGGNADIVEHDVSGFVVPPGSRPALAGAISRMLSMAPEERERMGIAAREKVEREYDIERILDRWEEIYGELLSRKTRRAAASARPILTDSSMWQSEYWKREATSVYRFDTRWPFLNQPVLRALRLFVRRGRYSTVLTTGNKCSLVYGMLCRLTLLDQRQVISELFLDPPRGVLKPVQDSLMRFMLRGVRGVLAPSRGEMTAVAERFHVPIEKIRYVPFHTNVIEPEDLGCASGPVFAGGRNYRDYETLVEAVRGTDIEVVIVCGQEQMLDTDLPPNVTVYRELPYQQYLAHMRGASVVVVPLSSTDVTSGHSSILEGMAYGKPVITTDARGTVDYVRHGVDGLLYRHRDVEDLRSQLLALAADDEYRKKLGCAAYESVVASFTFELHAAAMLRTMDELAERGGSGGRSSDTRSG